MSDTTTTEGNKPVKKPRLTKKEIEFIKGLAAGKTKQQAALDAYDTQDPNTASAIASENLNKPRLQEALAAAYESAGIDEQSITKVFKEAMGAKKTQIYDGVLLETELPDHPVRVNAARTAVGLLGWGTKDPSGNITLNFNNGTQNYIHQAEIKP